jgi:hypothetical protein
LLVSPVRAASILAISIILVSVIASCLLASRPAHRRSRGHDGLGVVEKRRDEAGNQLGLRHDADVRRAWQDRQARARRFGYEALRRCLLVAAAAQLEQFDGVLQPDAVGVANDDHVLPLIARIRSSGQLWGDTSSALSSSTRVANASGVGDSRLYSRSIGPPAKNSGVTFSIA